MFFAAATAAVNDRGVGGVVVVVVAVVLVALALGGGGSGAAGLSMLLFLLSTSFFVVFFWFLVARSGGCTRPQDSHRPPGACGDFWSYVAVGHGICTTGTVPGDRSRRFPMWRISTVCLLHPLTLHTAL